MGVGRIVVIVVVLFGGLIFAFIGKAKTGNEHCEAMCRLIANVEGYEGAKGYYEGLVQTAHDLVFDDAHHMEPAGRRRVKTWVDEEKYFNDMFKTMIRLAEEDRAPHVAAAFQRFYDKHRGVEPPPPAPARKNQTRKG
jgi:hypothetical protein